MMASPTTKAKLSGTSASSPADNPNTLDLNHLGHWDHRAPTHDEALARGHDLFSTVARWTNPIAPHGNQQTAGGGGTDLVSTCQARPADDRQS
jgi:hypothetical protein